MLNIEKNIPLAPMTTFGIGGLAKFFAEIFSVDDLKDALEFAKENKIDFYVLSGGSNVLVSDQGFDGLVMRIKIGDVKVEGNKIAIGAGVPLMKAVNEAVRSGLSGLEPLAGIPGAVGGAVRGNAGAYGSQISDHVERIITLESNTLEEKIFSKDDAEFGYRSSIFKKNKNLIVTSVVLSLDKGDAKESLEKIKEIISKRKNTGLYSLKSAGSFFTNPIVTNKNLKEEFAKDTGAKPSGDSLPAGWLIDNLGLRGKKMGGAMISEKHGNYICNAGNAKAEEIIMLASYIKQQVRTKYGIQLQEEVSYVGF